MNAFAKLAVASVVVVAVVGAIYLVRPGAVSGEIAAPAPAGVSSPVETAAPGPTAAAKGFRQAGTFTLAADGCTWADRSSPIRATTLVFSLANDTSDWANFGVYRLKDGRTWQEAVDLVATIHEGLRAGDDVDMSQTLAVEYGERHVPAAGTRHRTLTLDVIPGTYGVVCSANEPPPGAIYSAYLVGPIVVD
jgi:hypothetical protein